MPTRKEQDEAQEAYDQLVLHNPELNPGKAAQLRELAPREDARSTEIHAVKDASPRIRSAHYTLTLIDPNGTAPAMLGVTQNLTGRTEVYDLDPGTRLDAVRVDETDDLAAEAEEAARTMAPPVPGITTRMGFVMRALVTTSGRQTAWFVAAENTERGSWVTWRAEAAPDGRLYYDHGHYFEAGATDPGLGQRFDTVRNRARALADLADRAGMITREPRS